MREYSRIDAEYWARATVFRWEHRGGKKHRSVDWPRSVSLCSYRCKRWRANARICALQAGLLSASCCLVSQASDVSIRPISSNTTAHL